jgi:hypothetical protein
LHKTPIGGNLIPPIGVSVLVGKQVKSPINTGARNNLNARRTRWKNSQLVQLTLRVGSWKVRSRKQEAQTAQVENSSWQLR